MIPTSTSLTLRAIVKKAAGRLKATQPARRVSGLPPAAKAYYVAAAATETPIVLVVPTDGDIEQMVCDVRFFLGALEGMTAAELEQGVLPFPSHEIDPYRGLSPHFDVTSARARALHALGGRTARVVVASAAALLPRVSAPGRLLSTAISLEPGQDISPATLGEVLADAGFTREDPVDEHGEFCVRGGVVDFFAPGESDAVRLEFIGDTIESIRQYDPATQRSLRLIDRTQVVPLRELFFDEDAPAEASPVAAAFERPDRSSSFFDYLTGRRHRIFVSERDDTLAHGAKAAEQARASYEEIVERGERAIPPADLLVAWTEVEARLDAATALEQLSIDEPDAETDSRDRQHIATQPAMEFRGRIAEWAAEIRRARERGEVVVFVAATAGRAERTVEVLAEYDLIALPIDLAEDTHAAAVLVATGQLSRGFRLQDAGLQLFAETDVFDEERRVHERRRSLAGKFLADFRDLKLGDLVVHVDHGIGVFVGLKKISVGHQAHEFMELRYAEDDKLFVPVERLDLIQKYTGASRPSLDRLGGTTWERAKTRVKRAMRDMAEELLRLYAARKSMAGHAFGPDSHWQQEFDDAFEYELTPDQTTALSEIKRDMESPSPMDRLLCGDVGYGKTEVAMRAAFKAVLDAKQVAFLAPTTVLAFQHLKTLKDRFAAFPVRIDMVSRFRTKAEQAQVIADLAAGRIDLIVGTHRLLSKDVVFRDLGLLIVDEEQRFGVAHKEKIKQLRRRIDVLTMTATPIPRTLNMSLVGIRDMSVIETPPKDRLSIQTSVVKFDAQVIARGIRNELERGGQVYFVHNRVESIFSIANLIGRLVPEARLVVAHGQMGEAELERAMVDFVARKYDVLLATTIIENGLDIPNANTMIVNRADRYGLSQLYQLRGRVGRSDRRAYAYLLIPPEDSLSPVARKRLAAIKEFSDLGSGFRIAALDLEIRGAGNLLGGEQSGHIEAIGFEMYMKLLEQTVRELKGEEIEDDTRAAVNLKIDLKIEEPYISDMNQRLTVYRKVAGARTEADLQRTVEELTDRYGPVPDSVLNLVEYGRVRILADRLRVETIDREGPSVVLKFRSDTRVDPAELVRLVRVRPSLTLIPPAALKLDLRPHASDASRPSAGSPPGRGQRPNVMKRAPSGAAESWWTTRATAGEVRPGFSRQEILKPPDEDPRGTDGVLTRLSELLGELSRTA